MLNKDKIRVYTLPLPEEMKDVAHATFTATGSVLCDWHKSEDEKDFIRLSVCDKNGENLRHIFADVIPLRPDANGIRFMCFSDGKRVLLGDWVLECEPSIDECETARLLPVIYPPMEKGGLHWTEIVVDPSGEYMAWTALAGFSGSVNLIARLVRYESEYRLEDVRTICTLDAWVKDEQNEGYMLPDVMRGGEIKQFVRGGSGISMVGIGSQTVIADSVVQDLITGDMEQITHTPGYDETTIFSPDEKLGLVMSTRFSPNTNCAILSLMPRPYANKALTPLIMPVYLYSVASVRRKGYGNIGPALIEIERSKNEQGYLGIDLSDQGSGYTYCSPMSWHPSSKYGMWNEISTDRKARIRIAELTDYEAGELAINKPVPENIAFAQGADAIHPMQTVTSPIVKVKGKAQGLFIQEHNEAETISIYENYSDDGVNFFNGSEKVRKTQEGYVYEGDLKLTGDTDGEIKLTLIFRLGEHFSYCCLDEASNGYVVYGDKKLTTDNMPKGLA